MQNKVYIYTCALFVNASVIRNFKMFGKMLPILLQNVRYLYAETFDM